MRALASATALLLACAWTAPAAQARDLMLDSDTEPGSTGLVVSGLAFTVLTLGSLAYASAQYQKSQDELDKADESYALYKDATTTADALAYRAQVEKHHNRAKNAETRTNVSLALAGIFALTAFYSFFPDAAPNMSLSATLDGARVEWRF